MLDAKTKLKELASQLDKEIDRILNKEHKISQNISPLIDKFIKNTKSIPMAGGKRLRGAFVYYGYLICGGKDTKEIMKAAAAIELIHAYLLVHDDVQDKGDFRRGSPTIHKIYEEVHRKTAFEQIQDKANAYHFGESIAINSGDVLNHIGMLTLIQSDFSDKRKMLALERLNRRIIDVGYGQTLDIFGGILDKVGEDYVILVQKYKTGFYTYELPLHMGAILAGGNGEFLKALAKYALPGGIAFQIQDDILGVFGEEENTGKSASGDILEGKKTLLTIKAYEKASRKDRIILNNTLGNPKASKEMVDAVKKIMIDTGSVEYSKEMAKKLLTQSTKALLTRSDWNKEGLHFLIGINDYMLNRKL